MNDSKEHNFHSTQSPEKRWGVARLSIQLVESQGPQYKGHKGYVLRLEDCWNKHSKG